VAPAGDLVTIPDLMTAPQLAPLPKGLPGPRTAPIDGHWVGKDGSEHSKGTYLPYELDLEVLRRLRLLDAFPRLVQVQMDKQREVAEFDCDGRLAVTEAKFLAEREAVSPGWSTLEVIGAGLLGVVIGGAVAAIVAVSID